jgi:hypothetical protein
MVAQLLLTGAAIRTIWLTQKAIAELFDVGIPTITKHLKSIYAEDELDRGATISKKEVVQTEGAQEAGTVGSTKRAVFLHFCLQCMVLYGIIVHEAGGYLRLSPRFRPISERGGE